MCAIPDDDAGIRILDPRELLAYDGLGQAKRAEAHLMMLVRRERANFWNDLLVEHALHLARNARHEERARLPVQDGEPRRGADGILQNLCRFGKISLFRVGVAHGPADSFEATANVLEGFLVSHERLSNRLCDREGRQIVRRRPEPAGRDDDLVLAREALERADDA